MIYRGKTFGTGQFMITSIYNDGSMAGEDIELIILTSDLMSIRLLLEVGWLTGGLPR